MVLALHAHGVGIERNLAPLRGVQHLIVQFVVGLLRPELRDLLHVVLELVVPQVHPSRPSTSRE